MKRCGYAFGLCLALLSVGCAKKVVEQSDTPTIAGESGSALAYTHRVTVDLTENQIAARIDSVRDACASERHGSCSMLYSEVSGSGYPSGKITVRIVPDGVAPIVAMAAERARISARSTQAEDLATEVADTERQQARLTSERDRLLVFQERKDLKAGDLVAIATALANVETALQQTEQTAAQQRRRIETNRLTIHFTAPMTTSHWEPIANAFVNVPDSLADGIAEAVEMFVFGLPFVLLAFPLALLWRALWRRVTTPR